jgi:hypothetical protein
MRNVYWWRGEAMPDTGSLLERSGNPDLSGMLVEDSVFIGYNKRESFENPVSRNQHPVSFGFLLKSYSKTCFVC